MMQTVQGGKPVLKKKKGGIAGAIGDLLERARAAGRPSMADSVPGGPKRKQPIDEYEIRFGGNRDNKRPPIPDDEPIKPVKRMTFKRFTMKEKEKSRLPGGGR